MFKTNNFFIFKVIVVLLFAKNMKFERKPSKYYPRIVAGFHNYHPSYDNDFLLNEHIHSPLTPMPYGLPIGGQTSDGRSYGLVAYLIRGDPKAHHILTRFQNRYFGLYDLQKFLTQVKFNQI